MKGKVQVKIQILKLCHYQLSKSFHFVEANNPAKITTKTIETPQDSEDNIEEEPKTLYQV